MEFRSLCWRFCHLINATHVYLSYALDWAGIGDRGWKRRRCEMGLSGSYRSTFIDPLMKGASRRSSGVSLAESVDGSYRYLLRARLMCRTTECEIFETCSNAVPIIVGVYA